MDTSRDRSWYDHDILRDPETLEPLYDKMDGYGPVDYGFAVDAVEDPEGFYKEWRDMSIDYHAVMEEIYFRQLQREIGLRT